MARAVRVQDAENGGSREAARFAGGRNAAGHDPAVWEETARRYDSCHRDDSFRDLCRRSSFSKEDRRLMEDWLAATEADRRRSER